MTTGIGHRDISRALCAGLAVLREQSRATDIVAEVRDLGASDEFTEALLTAFATLLQARCSDPEEYALAWIAVELASRNGSVPPKSQAFR